MKTKTLTGFIVSWKWNVGGDIKFVFCKRVKDVLKEKVELKKLGAINITTSNKVTVKFPVKK